MANNQRLYRVQPKPLPVEKVEPKAFVTYPHVEVVVNAGLEPQEILEKVIDKMASQDAKGEFLVDAQKRREFITRLIKLPREDWVAFFKRYVVLRIVDQNGNEISEKLEKAGGEE
jgi:hypothetical protein